MAVPVTTYEITTPHPDLELGMNRDPIIYKVFGDPTNAPRGILFFISPFGMNSDTPYVEEKLMPALHAMGFLGVNVDYFGCFLKIAGSRKNVSLVPPPGWVEAILQKLQLPPPSSFWDLLGAIRDKGFSEIDPSMPVMQVVENEYQSFGWLPALDHVQVYGDLCSRHGIKPRHVVLYGSSYGGYIAMMIAKMMPDSFSFLIENSGFVTADRQSLNNRQTKISHPLTLNGVKLYSFEESPWELSDARHKNFFSPAHAAIRDLRVAGHFEARPIPVVSYHSREDTIVPIAEKRAMWSVWKDRFHLNAFEIGRADVDGRLFKSLEHGMDASLIGLAEHAFSIADPASYTIERNDFERGTVRTLKVPDGAYEVTFRPDFTVTARIVKQ